MEQYAADKVSVIVGGTPITGFAEGAFVDVARAVESATLYVGADGKGTMVINPNKSGTIVVRLKQSSLSNAVLSSLEATSAVVPVIVKDTSGNSLHSAAKAFVSTMPTSTYAQELNMGRIVNGKGRD
jgi:hypothetical protein